MSDKKENFKLLDLVDKGLLQKFQDFFAKALDVACITLDTTGPVTKASNYCEFCKINIKNRISEDLECDLHDPKWGKIAAEKDEPTIFKCRTGLTSFVVPIIINDVHLGGIIAGQIFTEPPNEEAFRKYAKNNNLNEDEYIQALRKIKIIPLETIKAAANLLQLLANTISEIARKNFELIKKNQREDLYNNMVETIRSSLNIEKTLEIISHEISKLFDIQRVAILEFPNKENLQNFYVRKEYKTEETIKSSQEISGYDKIGEYAANQILKSKKPLVINDLEKSEYPNFFKNFYLSMGVKSIIWLPLMSKEQLWGFISLSKTDSYNWENEDISLLKSTAYQLLVAINQAELYEKERRTAERESVLRKTIEVIRSKFNSEEIKNYFVKITGNFFNADRCLFVDYDRENNKFLPFRIENLKSPEIKSLVGIDVENKFPEFAAKLKKGKNIIIKDLDKTLSRKKLAGYKAVKTLQKSDVKSDYGLVVKYKNQIIGILILHFTESKRILTHEEFIFLKILRDEVGIALYQAELYSKTKLQAERETLIRNITETVRSTLDISETKQKIVNIVGKTLKADRCFIAEYDKLNDKFLLINDEYISSDEITAYKGADANIDVPNFVEALKKGKSLLINNKEIFLNQKKNQTFDIEKEAIEKHNVNSAYSVPLYYQKEFMGTLTIHYVKEKHYIGKEEIDLMNVIANQVAIAIHQANSYRRIQLQAEREKLLGNIIAKAISTLDINEIKKIVKEVGVLMNADRCWFTEADLKTRTATPVDSDGEYLSSPNIKSIVGYEFPRKHQEEAFNIYLNKKDVIVFDFTKEQVYKGKIPTVKSEQYPEVKKFGELFKLKSNISIPFIYMNELKGLLSIDYVNETVFPSDDELDFLRILGNQIGMAINQIQLYQNTQRTAEREKLVGDIITKSLSAFDINQIKQIVKEVGTIMKADRCFFVEADPQRVGQGTPIDSDGEYLGSSDIKSMAGYYFPYEDTVEFISLYLRIKDVVIIDYESIEKGQEQYDNIQKYCTVIKLDENPSPKIKKFGELFNVKIGISVPFIYMNEVKGVLAIEYIKGRRFPTEDELYFLRILGNQMGMAINQIQLYKNTKKTAEREKLIANIITKAVSTLDTSQIRKMVTDIGITMNADRCFFTEAELGKKPKPYTPDSEYLSSSNIKSLVGYELPTEFVEDCLNIFMNAKDVVIFNFKSSFQEEYEKYHKNMSIIECDKYPLIKEYGELADIKLGIGVPFIYMNELKGVLTIEYVKERTFPTEDELNFLRILGNQMGIAVNQIQLYQNTKKIAERESLLRKIFEIMRSSLDVNVIKNLIVNEIGKIFNANICFIVLFDYEKDYLYIDEYSEYRSSSKEKSYIGVNQEDPRFSWWAEMFKAKTEINFANVEDFIIENKLQNTPVEEYLVDYGVKSAYCISISYTSTFLGYLIINYTKEYTTLDEDDISFLKNISTQSGTALYQAKLYETTQLQAEREKLITNIITRSISTFDINEIKKIVKDIGIMTKADRCYFVEVDLEKKTGIPIDSDGEYLSSSNIKSVIGYNFTAELVEETLGIYLNKKSAALFDFESLKEQYASHIDSIYKINVKKYPELIKYGDMFDVRIGVGIPFIYMDEYKALLVLDYVTERNYPSDDELNFLMILGNQIGMAISQIQLYQNTKKTAERESSLRKLFEAIRSYLDIDFIKKTIVEEIGKAMEADRCFITIYNPQTDGFTIDRSSEYKSSENIKSIIGVDSSTENKFQYTANRLKNREEAIFTNVEEYINKNKLQGMYGDMLKEYSLKSSYGIPIFYVNNLFGGVFIQYTRDYKILDENDMVFLRTLATQAGIALHQAKLYETTQLQAKRENSLRNIFEAIRESLDSNVIKNTIVNEIGRELNVDTCFITAYDPDEDYFYIDEYSEYLSSQEEKSLIGADEKNPKFKWFINQFRNRQEIKYANVEEFIIKNNLQDTPEEEFIKEYHIKSSYSLPIYYGNNILGYISLGYTKNYRNLDENELNFLRSLATQAGIAINQAYLYKKMQLQAEREKLIANVITKAISTLDISQIRQTVKEIGLMTKADRCYFVEVDMVNKMAKPINLDGEYLSSPDIKSVVGYDFSSQHIQEAFDIYSSKKDIVIFDFKDPLKEDDRYRGNMPTVQCENYPGVTKYGETLGVKSGIGLPFTYMDEFKAILVIEYVNKKIFPSDDELNFLRILGNQMGMAINQIQLYQNTKKTAEREKIIANTTAIAISTFDIKQIKQIVNDVGKIMKADKCFFVESDSQKKGQQGLPLDSNAEYLSSPDIKSAAGYRFSAEQISEYIDLYLNKKDVIIVDYEKSEKGKIQYPYIEGYPDIIKAQEEKYLQIRKFGELFNTKIGISVPFIYMNELKGVLAIEYIKERTFPSIEELNFLRILGNQIGIALNQIQVYRNTIKTAERERLIANIIAKTISTLDISQIKKMVKDIGVIMKADRCYFAEANLEEKTTKPIDPDGQYLASPDIESIVGYEFSIEAAREYINIHSKEKDILVIDYENHLEQFPESKRNYKIFNPQNRNYPEIKRYGEMLKTKTGIGIPFFYMNELKAVLAIDYVKERVFPTDDEIDFLRILGNQIGIAVNQIQLYQNTVKTAERENLLRKTFEAMRSSLDINTVRKTIVEEIGKALGADICFMPVYDDENNTFIADEYSEYKSSSDLKSYAGTSSDDPKFKFFVDIFKNKKEVYNQNAEEFIIKNNLQGTAEEEYLREYNIKSSYAIAIFYAEKLIGYLLIQYINNYKTLHEDDLIFLRTLAAQAGVSLYQANLYKITQIQTESEKINRKMVEILRSSLDKNTIKHLLVQNIGKFINANRVFFSDYDSKRNIYLPVDKYSEYRYSFDEKSFVGYDWSQDSIREYIQPMVEKRELLIPCLNEYLKDHHKGHDFIARFKDANVKSSYNFPVLYQEKIVGYFCIEFTGKDCKKLPIEDISRIRNICIQAGVALYQSELYLRAIESAQSKELFIASISNELQMLLNNIVEISELLKETEFTQDNRIIEYLDNIYASNKQLFDLQDNISNIAQIESESFKLNYENIYSEGLIRDVINSIRPIAEHKYMQIDEDITHAEIYADKERLIQILYNLLSNIIKLIPEKGYLLVKSEIQENKLIISIKISGRDLSPDVRNMIFETVKPIDSDFKIQRRDIRLGLTIAKKLIELHDGYIHVDSTEDMGTNIWFALPNVIAN